ncbi:WSSV033 [White spot syndrome virus]|uniref:WSSV033 n=1 Tax=White spot syndrome virus TaxID=342409 RepID=A0A2I6SBH0_9VIRU|nr:WSSV033 [White spot syndrome virus]
MNKGTGGVFARIFFTDWACIVSSSKGKNNKKAIESTLQIRNGDVSASD